MTDEQYAEIVARRERLKRLEAMAQAAAEQSDAINAALREKAGRPPPVQRAPDCDEPDHERRQALRQAAALAGYHDPADAVALLADRDGDPAQLVAKLSTERPYLRADMNAALRQAAGRGPRPAAPEPQAEEPARPTGSADAGNEGTATPPGTDMNRQLRRIYHRSKVRLG